MKDIIRFFIIGCIMCTFLLIASNTISIFNGEPTSDQLIGSSEEVSTSGYIPDAQGDYYTEQSTNSVATPPYPESRV